MSADRFLPTDTALVTGASSGIGYELAKALDQYGLKHIYLVARRKERLTSLASQLACESTIVQCDLSNKRERKALFGSVKDVDILINNAGFGLRGVFQEQSLSSLSDMIELHVNATVEMCHHFLKGMRQKRRGYIVNVGSSIGEFSVPNSAMYCATKAFINNFTETLRMEEDKYGIKAMLLAPGPVKTEFFAQSQVGRTIPKGALSPQIVSQICLNELLNGTPRHMPDWKIRLLVTAARHMPRTVCYSLIHNIHRLKINARSTIRSN
ncbi:MAG: SDR family NAD(P)-dependent oxidoreductase [Myxococcota bacterium]|nr:SDR family NAD(P)-dependent oxidoreductase [Myxococcota bacterium]